MDSSFGGDVSAALAHAATLPTGGIVALGPHTYTLNASLVLPNRTVLRGTGKATTKLVLTPYDIHGIIAHTFT